jgi:hypothetical protein
MRLVFLLFVPIPAAYIISRLNVVLLFGMIPIIFNYYILLQMPFKNNSFIEFLNRPIQFEKNSSKKLSELNKETLNFLIKWSNSRRESLKNRLNFFTIIFAFLGIFIVIIDKNFLFNLFVTYQFSIEKVIISNVIVGLAIFNFLVIFVILYGLYRIDFINEISIIALNEKLICNKEITKKQLVNKENKNYSSK